MKQRCLMGEGDLRRTSIFALKNDTSQLTDLGIYRQISCAQRKKLPARTWSKQR